MNPSLTVKKTGAALAICAALSSPVLAEQQPTTSVEVQPNIVFIIADDYRYDFLSSAGHPFVKTPNIDRLVNEGVMFKDAFVSASLSSPSRASFITGMYPEKHKVKNNFTPWDNKNIGYYEHLQDAGYKTAFIGKWHMPGGYPKLRNLDEHISFEWHGGQGAYYGTPYIANGKELEYGVSPMEGVELNGYITDELTAMNNKFMENSVEEGKPFAIYLSHKAVHLPMKPDEEAKGKHKDTNISVPKGGTDMVGMTDSMFKYTQFLSAKAKIKDYAETAEAMDQQIGLVLDKLDDLGVADNTIVVFAGDNGYLWGEHRMTDKRWAYEESMRIPLVIRYPNAKWQKGAKPTGMAMNVDVAPTLLDLAGVKVPEYMQGKSLTPVLTGSKDRIREDVYYKYYEDFPYPAPQQTAIRTDKFKLIDFDSRRADELYDLINDSAELNNLYDDPNYQDIKAELIAKMAEKKNVIKAPIAGYPELKE